MAFIERFENFIVCLAGKDKQNLSVTFKTIDKRNINNRRFSANKCFPLGASIFQHNLRQFNNNKKTTKLHFYAHNL